MNKVAVPDQGPKLQTPAECWPSSLRDKVISHLAIRFGRLDKFQALHAVRKSLLGLLGRDGIGVQFDTTYNLQVLLPAWDADMVIAAMNGRILHPWITQILRDVVRPGFTVVDGGANIGFYSVLCAKLLQGEGMVFSFEPDPRNIPLLESNARLNRVTRTVRLERTALSNAPGELDFWFSTRTSLFGSIVATNGSQDEHIRVPATTLDEYLSLANIRSADVIKLDIEGAEPFALEGMRRNLESTRLLIYEINAPRLAELKITPKDLIHQATAWGRFTTTLVTDERIDALFPLADPRSAEIINQYGWANVISAKEEAAEYLRTTYMS